MLQLQALQLQTLKLQMQRNWNLPPVERAWNFQAQKICNLALQLQVQELPLQMQADPCARGSVLHQKVLHAQFATWNRPKLEDKP